MDLFVEEIALVPILESVLATVASLTKEKGLNLSLEAADALQDRSVSYLLRCRGRVWAKPRFTILSAERAPGRPHRPAPLALAKAPPRSLLSADLSGRT
jgi:hypothetical protein